jgi:LPXTG-motif cell wall-anchored protein
VLRCGCCRYFHLILICFLAFCAGLFFLGETPTFFAAAFGAAFFTGVAFALGLGEAFTGVDFTALTVFAGAAFFAGAFFFGARKRRLYHDN